MHRTAYTFCHSQHRYSAQEVFSAAPESIKHSFSCLFAHHSKRSSQAHSDVADRGDHESEQGEKTLSSPLADTGALTETVSNLFSALENYTSSLNSKKSPLKDIISRDFQFDHVKAAVQMLLITATDDLCMNALYRRRMEGITTILGTTYVDDFVRVWRTWDQWWREAAILLSPESLLAGEDGHIFARSPIEAYVQRYKAPILTRSVDASVRKVKDDFLLTHSFLHTEKTVRREESALIEKARRKKALLKDLTIQRMKDSCTEHPIANYIHKGKTSWKVDNLLKVQTPADCSLDFKPMDLNAMAETFLSSCLKNMCRNKKHRR